MADEDTSQPPAEPTAPVEPATAPESAPSEPVETPPAETQTAQVPVNEPLPPEAEPFDSAQGKPTPAPAPEPPEAAASASATPATASTSSPQATHPSRDLLVKARATIQDRKHKKLEKILEALNTKGKITNDEVE